MRVLEVKCWCHMTVYFGRMLYIGRVKKNHCHVCCPIIQGGDGKVCFPDLEWGLGRGGRKDKPMKVTGKHTLAHAGSAVV